MYVKPVKFDELTFKVGPTSAIPVIVMSSIPAPIVALVPATVNLIFTCVPTYELKSISVCAVNVEFIGVQVPNDDQLTSLSVEIHILISFSITFVPP